jgi:hypothetical protein
MGGKRARDDGRHDVEEPGHQQKELDLGLFWVGLSAPLGPLHHTRFRGRGYEQKRGGEHALFRGVWGQFL